MKTVFVLYRDGENHGQQTAVGWFETEVAAKATAVRMEVDEYRKEAATPRTMPRLLSPEETEYRRFSVEAVQVMGQPEDSRDIDVALKELAEDLYREGYICGLGNGADEDKWLLAYAKSMRLVAAGAQFREGMVQEIHKTLPKD